jgi:hypothetical protein
MNAIVTTSRNGDGRIFIRPPISTTAFAPSDW